MRGRRGRAHDEHREGEAEARKPRRGRQVGQELVRYRHAADDRVAEIAGEEIAQRLEVLLPERTVDAIGVAQRGDLFGAEAQFRVLELDQDRIARQCLQ